MTISIIIPTLNRINDLTVALQSIEGQTYPPKEVIIVDQSDDTKTKDFVESYNQTTFKIVYLYTSYRSLTRARNLGIDNIDKGTDLVIFFDDDVILDNDYLEKIDTFFNNDKDRVYFGATGYIKNCERKSKLSPFLKLFFLQEYRDGRFKRNGLPTFQKYNKSPYETEFLSGCNMTYRKEVFKKYRFDEAMVKYCYMEDADFSYRVSREHRFIFLPEAQVTHNVSPVNRLKERENASFFIQNYLYLFKKNIKKSFANIFTLLWSILGMFIIATIFLKFDKISGYVNGIVRDITKNSSSIKIDGSTKN